MGREMNSLVNESKGPGVYTLEFEADHLRAGVYFYKLRVGERVQTRKFVVSR